MKKTGRPPIDFGVGIEGLCVAIAFQAYMDYAYSTRYLTGYAYGNKESAYIHEKRVKECEEFFKGADFHAMFNLDGSDLLDEINRKLEVNQWRNRFIHPNKKKP